MKGYKIDFTSSTITITADFAKKIGYTSLVWDKCITGGRSNL